MRVVADAHRLRAAVAVEMRQLALRHSRFAEDVVQHLQARLGETRGVEEPVDERGAFALEAAVVQGGDGERRVAQPAVSIVPVADAAHRLGERCGGGGDDRAGWRVRQQLQHQHAAHDEVAIRPVVFELRRPFAPVGDGFLDLAGAEPCENGRRVIVVAECERARLARAQREA